jgi:hypothetical protein
MTRWKSFFCALSLSLGTLTASVNGGAAQQPAPATNRPAPATVGAAGTAAPTRRTAKSGEPAGFRGPRVELSYRLYSLRDYLGGRSVHTGGFAGFLPTRFVRAGGGVEAGVRNHEFGERQGLVSGNLFVGYQHLRNLGPVVPYLCVLGELGIVVQKRFHTPQSNSFRGAGVELGADVNLVRSLYVGLGLSFMLYTMDGLAYDTFGLRLSIGL